VGTSRPLRNTDRRGSCRGRRRPPGLRDPSRWRSVPQDRRRLDVPGHEVGAKAVAPPCRGGRRLPDGVLLIVVAQNGADGTAAARGSRRCPVNNHIAREAGSVTRFRSVSGPATADVTSAGRYCRRATFPGDSAHGILGSTAARDSERFTSTRYAKPVHHGWPGRAARPSVNDSATLSGTATQPANPVINLTGTSGAAVEVLGALDMGRAEGAASHCCGQGGPSCHMW
jgi:hypothetical protein